MGIAICIGIPGIPGIPIGMAMVGGCWAYTRRTWLPDDGEDSLVAFGVTVRKRSPGNGSMVVTSIIGSPRWNQHYLLELLRVGLKLKQKPTATVWVEQSTAVMKGQT